MKKGRRRGIGIPKKLLVLLLCMMLAVASVPFTSHADYEDGTYCEHCGGYRYDDWLCEYGPHCAKGYGCGDEHHCSECDVCESEEDYCEDHGKCVECAIDDKEHCRECGECDSRAHLCDVCGVCDDCWSEDSHCEYCHACEEDVAICEYCMMCEDCAEENEYHCIGCGECSVIAKGFCDVCVMCWDCAIEEGSHCVDCGEHFEEDALCEECGRCYENCGGSCSEGHSHLCLECHLEEDLACPNCGQCLVDDHFLCDGCGDVCSACYEWCEECVLCNDCAVDAG